MAIVAVDAMGGDDAPGAIVAGAAEASLQSDIQIRLIGDEAEVSRLLSARPHEKSRIQVIPSTGRIPTIGSRSVVAAR